MDLYLSITTFLLAAVAASGGLVAICAATSRVHWFWRVFAVWVFVAAMLPIRAYEPAVVFGIGLPLGAMCIRVLQWFQQPAVPQAEARSNRAQLRFGILDSLLAITLIGLTLAIVLQIWAKIPARANPPQTWKEYVIPAASLASIVVLSWCGGRGFRRWWAIVGLVILIPFWTWLIWPNTYWLYSLDDERGVYYMLAGDFADRDRYLSGSEITVLGMTEFSFLLMASLAIWYVAGCSSWFSRARTVGGALASGALALLYLQMYWLAAVPPPIVSEPNNFSRVMEIAEEIEGLNKQAVAIADLSKTEAKAAQRLNELYREIMPLLDVIGSLPDDLSTEAGWQARERNWSNRYSHLRSLSKSLEAEATSAVNRGDLRKAVHYALANVRLGAIFCRNAVMVDELVGRAAIDRGAQTLITLREQLESELSHEVGEVLGIVESEHESAESLLKREVAYSQRAYGWQARLGHIALWINFGPPEHWKNNKAFLISIREMQAINRMLRIELAAYCYRAKSGKFPSVLDQLVPDYLLDVPIDPFTQKPFVYRDDDGAIMLYCVGRDGVDSGGKFTDRNTYYSGDGYDLDLETLTRK
ncbi:MAG TPA: hypothetical protein VGI40_09650 [Pirellulaceae bacterium]|jgi:hypothetical protein